VKDIGYIPSRTRQILLITIGIAGVVIGAEILINSAVVIMKIFGVDEKFIGLTVVALGTSLPELATSVVAALKKEMDISIGNLVGSNVFNILSVLGAASLVKPIPIPGGFIHSGLLIDYMVMMFISFLPWLIMRKTYCIRRKDGAILLTCYVLYVVYLILKAWPGFLILVLKKDYPWSSFMKKLPNFSIKLLTILTLLIQRRSFP